VEGWTLVEWGRRRAELRTRSSVGGGGLPRRGRGRRRGRRRVGTSGAEGEVNGALFHERCGCFLRRAMRRQAPVERFGDGGGTLLVSDGRDGVDWCWNGDLQRLCLS